MDRVVNIILVLIVLYVERYRISYGLLVVGNDIVIEIVQMLVFDLR